MRDEEAGGRTLTNVNEKSGSNLLTLFSGLLISHINLAPKNKIGWAIGRIRGTLIYQARPSSLRCPLKDLVIQVERTKAQIRARVEHPSHIVKNLFRRRKVRYRGLAKNMAQLFSLFALANLAIARNRLRSVHGSSPSCV
ncbi:DDE family transposase [Paraburkholderia sp. BL18I3N2]|nr:DDE family transposase [Paraburkholderia sp. BL18I3N2]PRX85359.1 DDE family transposase [Paraburkholderia sp. BL25I1N1]